MMDFYSAVASVLEVPSVGPETRFREVAGYCSLYAFGLLVLLENDYGVRLTLDEFKAFNTVGELASLIGKAS